MGINFSPGQFGFRPEAELILTAVRHQSIWHLEDITAFEFVNKAYFVIPINK